MPEETPVEVNCPYCGETLELLIDTSQKDQSYVEDCQVCCKPMKVHAEVDEEGAATASVSQEP
jgi:hypothetical protein